MFHYISVFMFLPCTIFALCFLYNTYYHKLHQATNTRLVPCLVELSCTIVSRLQHHHKPSNDLLHHVFNVVSPTTGSRKTAMKTPLIYSEQRRRRRRWPPPPPWVTSAAAVGGLHRRRRFRSGHRQRKPP